MCFNVSQSNNIKGYFNQDFYNNYINIYFALSVLKIACFERKQFSHTPTLKFTSNSYQEETILLSLQH